MLLGCTFVREQSTELPIVVFETIRAVVAGVSVVFVDLSTETPSCRQELPRRYYADDPGDGNCWSSKGSRSVELVPPVCHFGCGHAANREAFVRG